MNKFGTLTMGQAIKIDKEYDCMTSEEFQEKVASQWNQGIVDESIFNDYEREFRTEIKKVFDEFYPETGGNRNKMYPLDLHVGLKVYEMLSPEHTNFTITDATDDDMWRHISVKIIPDLTYIRYPAKSEKGAKNINKKRFYSETRRIWIKTLWWYVFLSWQGNAESTYEVLKNNSVDNINKLIETPGKGYRLLVYRAMMREYASRTHNTKYFAGVTKLNNAKCKTIEPTFLPSGEEQYVKLLFDEVPILKEQEEFSDVEGRDPGKLE